MQPSSPNGLIVCYLHPNHLHHLAYQSKETVLLFQHFASAIYQCIFHYMIICTSELQKIEVVEHNNKKQEPRLLDTQMAIYSSKMLRLKEWVIGNQISHHITSSAV